MDTNTGQMPRQPFTPHHQAETAAHTPADDVVKIFTGESPETAPHGDVQLQGILLDPDTTSVIDLDNGITFIDLDEDPAGDDQIYTLSGIPLTGGGMTPPVLADSTDGDIYFVDTPVDMDSTDLMQHMDNPDLDPDINPADTMDTMDTDFDIDPGFTDITDF